MRWHNNTSDLKVGYEDVMIVPQRSDIPSRTDVKLTRKYSFKHSPYTITGLGVIAANMDTTGTFAMADVFAKHKMFVALHKHYSASQLLEFFSSNKKRRWDHVFITVGQGRDLTKILKVRADLVDTTWPKLINIDVANGMTESFVQTIKCVRKSCPNSVIMAGNVVGPNMAEHLMLCGADIAKIGIGSGSVCTTRVKAGVGYPQLSAVDEAAFTAHGLRGHICADGGCTRVGDICKAFASGSDFVMIGGMLAGTDECEGEWEHTEDPYTGEPMKMSLKFYGMASEDAQKKYNGGLKKYKAAEGKCVNIPYKGKAEEIVREIRGGLASACTYVGASRIKDLPKCASFVRCTRQENTVFS